MWKTPRRLFVDGFIYGFTVNAFLACWLMDMYGQDRWLDIVRYHWADSRISMPVEIVVLVTLGFVLVAKYRGLPKRLIEEKPRGPGEPV